MSLLVVFVLAKVCVLAGRELPLSAWTPIAYLWQDLLVVVLFALCDFRINRPWVGWTAYTAIVLYVAVNVPIARVLSTPLTWPLLRAARGPLADSIAYHASWPNVLLMMLVLATAGMLPRLLRRASARFLALAGAIFLPPLVVLGPLATAQIETAGLHRNVLVVLVTTAFPRLPALANTADWRASPITPNALLWHGLRTVPRSGDRGTTRVETVPQQGDADDLSRFPGAAAGRHVVLVLLESAGARYLRPYGAADDPMPNLTALAEDSLLFDNAYAIYPESIKGLFSVLCSRYPAIDTTPEAYAKLNTPSIAAVLSRAGYRTGLFHSGRFMYLGMDSIVRKRGYATLEDAGAIGGNHQSSFGVDEPSTVRRILSWIDERSPEQRFFVTYLPIAGHHPYETPERGPFPEEEDVDRYRNALHYADQALGQLVRGLRARGLDRNTLFVLCGDHGEAFGQHEGNYGHTFFIYEENVHVPYLLVAPGLLRGQVRVKMAASLVDTAPTILDFLGLPAPRTYQGLSLLDGRPRMALFFTDYSLGLLGLRDGPWKFIHELESRRSKLYNLDNDREERHDVSGSHADRVAAYRQHLLRWGGAQRSLVKSSTIAQ